MKTKRFLSVLLALLLILVYVPSVTAVSDGVEIQSQGNNWLHFKIGDSGINLTNVEGVCGYAYFNEEKFEGSLKAKDCADLKVLEEGKNPFLALGDGLGATHFMPLSIQGGQARCTDYGEYFRDSIVGIMLYHNNPNGSIEPALLSRDKLDLGTEAKGTLNTWIIGKPHFLKPNLTITKTSDPEPGTDVKPGDEITYTMTIKNNACSISIPGFTSLMTAYNCYVSDLVPLGTDRIRGSATIGGEATLDRYVYNRYTREYKFPVGNLAPQQEQTVSFRVKVRDIPDVFSDGYDIWNTAAAGRYFIQGLVFSNSIKHPASVPKIDIDGSKIWNDYENVGRYRPNSVIINLYQSIAEDGNGGEANDIATRDIEVPFRTQTIYENGTNEWDFLFEDVPEFDSEGNPYIYRVDEEYPADDDPGDFYIKNIDGFIITNNFDLAPGIAITKTVANLTTDGARGAEADIEVGETAGYEVTISNTGALDIDNVILRDDMAEIGQVAKDQFDNEYTFEDDGNGVACIYLESLEEGENVLILSYEYTATADDVDISPIVNTASVEAFIYKPDLQPMTRVMAVEDPEPTIVWTATDEASASINVTAPPPEETTTTTTTTEEETTAATEETTAGTLPTLDVITETIPLAEPTEGALPTIKPITTLVPLATPETIAVVDEQIPKSGERAPLWPIGLGLLALAAGMGLIVHKSKKQAETDENK